MLSEFENRLKLLELKCRRPVEHLLAGEYRSVFRGRGMEFEDVRAYQPGDDVRTMDWKVTARTGEPHIKRYIEEREQFIYLLVDVSASMLTGLTSKKRETMTEVCALLTLAAVKNHDRVGLVLFTDRIEQIVPPSKGRRHAQQIMDELLNFQPESRQTNFTEMLASFGHLARKHSVVFIVSDFLTEGYLNELRALAFRHDVNAICLRDPYFSGRHIGGLVRMEDSESSEQRLVDIEPSDGSSGGHSGQLKQVMMESGISLMDLEVGSDCVEALADFFHARQKQHVAETGG
ncbi:MAG: DUF58 domain-containing protein [Verrucomicrobiota bacterium]